jgi:cell division transport system permease protein
MRLQYVLGEAFRNIGRNALVVLGAILAVFISLSLTFGTLVFGEVVRVNTVQWAEDVRVLAFLQDDFRGVDELQAEVEGWEEVEAVVYFTKSQAQAEALEVLPEGSVTRELIKEDPSVVPASLRVKPADPDAYGGIVARLQGSPGVERVVSAGPGIDAMIAIRDGLQFIFWVLAIALGTAAVALIANTIHMAIYARREEIEIMRLVGASSWFVRTPFLLEGMIEGLVGAGLAVGLIVGLLQLAKEQLIDLPKWVDLGVASEFLVQRGIVILVFGVVAGAIGSSVSLAVHRYLKA